jgi:hypothetical protein
VNFKFDRLGLVGRPSESFHHRRSRIRRAPVDERVIEVPTRRARQHYKSMNQSIDERRQEARRSPAIDERAQPSLGDADFVCALSALERGHSRFLQGAVQAEGTCVYAVRLFLPRKGDGVLMPTTVRVSAKLAASDDLGDGLALGDGNALRRMLLEKAFAKLRGGYAFPDDGVDSAEAMRVLTGRPAWRREMSPRTLELLKLAVEDGNLTTAGTMTNAAVQAHLSSTNRSGRAGLDPGGFSYESSGLRASHSYVVTGIESHRPLPKISLREPLGWMAANARWATDTEGVFQLSIAEFALVFGHVTVGQAPTVGSGVTDGTAK